MGFLSVKKALLIALMVFCQYNLQAQDWEKLITDGGSSGNEIVSDMDVDDEGNIYIIGTFTGAISFGNIILNSNGSSDIYVAKYDSSGSVIYAVSFGSTANDFGNAIVADDVGNVYITGQYNEFFQFGTIPLGILGDTDIFTAKLDLNGTALWAKKGGGTI